MVESFVIVVLTVGILLQNWFWSRQNQRLVDKLMSRNYAEYVQAQGFQKVSEKSSKSQTEIDPDDADVLAELNAQLRL